MCGECSICLNPVRHTRKSKQLDCGHLYHGQCIDEWIASGGNTCPLCRNEVNRPSFKMTITIENVQTRASTIDEITDEAIVQILLSRFNLSQTSELVFNANDLEELDQIISDFGIVRGINVDASILHTE